MGKIQEKGFKVFMRYCSRCDEVFFTMTRGAAICFVCRKDKKRYEEQQEMMTV